jgi:arylformamidase
MYRHLTTQEEIDREYNPRLIVTDVDSIVKGWQDRSAATRANTANRVRRTYGATLAEYLDIFPADKPNAPIHVFIHGGYWRAFSADDFSFIADSGLARGATTIVVNYELCPKVGVAEIVRQVRAAVAWVWHNAPEFGADRDRIAVSGHSAGGHLVGRLIATPWKRDYGLPPDILKGCCAISGLFDLEPLRWSWLQPIVQFTGDDILNESPIRHPPLSPMPVLAAVGALESAEFHRQTDAYAEALHQSGTPAQTLDLPGRNHFTVLDDLAVPDGPLWRAVEDMLNG